MKPARSLVASLILSLGLLGGTAAMAQDHHEGPRDNPHEAAPHGEPHPGPQGYQRVQEPKGWNTRPPQADPKVYNHNFQAARSYHIGAYRRPPGWVAHHWAYGQVLPHLYWAPQFLIADYWLFSLEVPPAGFEWVRDDSDALLINTANGQILQVEYGVFG